MMRSLITRNSGYTVGGVKLRRSLFHSPRIGLTIVVISLIFVLMVARASSLPLPQCEVAAPDGTKLGVPIADFRKSAASSDEGWTFISSNSGPVHNYTIAMREMVDGNRLEFRFGSLSLDKAATLYLARSWKLAPRASYWTSNGVMLQSEAQKILLSRFDKMEKFLAVRHYVRENFYELYNGTMGGEPPTRQGWFMAGVDRVGRASIGSVPLSPSIISGEALNCYALLEAGFAEDKLETLLYEEQYSPPLR